MSTADYQVGGSHYIELSVQPWDAMQAWMSHEQFAGFLRGNCIKYLSRCDSKGGLDDLKKARHYLDKLIDLTETPNQQAVDARHAAARTIIREVGKSLFAQEPAKP